MLRGLWRLAKGERAGIGEFGGELDHFYASLAPLIGIPLAVALLMALQGEWQLALFLFLSSLAGTLLLPVAVYEFARLFGREQYWLRTATALNWSIWMVVPALFAAIFISTITVECGLAQEFASALAMALTLLYLFWYRLFALSAGLGVRYWQAGLILLVSFLVMVTFTVLPTLFHLGPDLLLPSS
jgi:hypothetical protein